MEKDLKYTAPTVHSFKICPINIICGSIHSEKTCLQQTEEEGSIIDNSNNSEFFKEKPFNDTNDNLWEY